MDTTTPEDEKAALNRAIKILGTQDALAAALGIRSPSITGWKNRERVPAERCADIERATAGQVTRYNLRPDVFGSDPSLQSKEVA